MKHITLGKIGEELAIEYLKKKKYKIIEKNFSSNIGEIDIIAQNKEAVVFVEVKSRTSAKFGLPREAVNWSKQQKIRNIALFYLKSKRWINKPCRFDVIDILDGEITHIENCF